VLGKDFVVKHNAAAELIQAAKPRLCAKDVRLKNIVVIMRP